MKHGRCACVCVCVCVRAWCVHAYVRARYVKNTGYVS